MCDDCARPLGAQTVWALTLVGWDSYQRDVHWFLCNDCAGKYLPVFPEQMRRVPHLWSKEKR